ncbi:hypothetical protein NIES3275_05610 [Microchaete diplosiphon NIES-3275]|nr:hypothetical protein NIES3275_05610 [Microchaete diplosiphon NIES-3275]
MTEYTILQVQALQKILAISFEVRFAGGNLQLMQDWLGSDLVYQPQGEGDLGDRMMRSLADAVASGKQQIIIIGIDCPGVNSQLLAMAFEQLDNFDMVLGPAMDGGYYLIGLRQSIPQLFANIDWGTSQVFSQTLDIAQQLNLSRADLPTLVDVDRPEDLPIWEQTIAREVADKTQ